MKNYLESVKEFHETFQPETVVDKIVDLDVERRKLRINLIFEELHELSEASGVEEHFISILKEKVYQMENKNFSQEVDKVETLDALSDLQYVLSGTILEYGLDSVFDTAFIEVHRSNMSKSHLSEEDALKTIEMRKKEHGEDCYFEKHGDKFVVKRTSDKKIIKNIKYSPADLSKFLKS
jgi:predicted HAD superfamily Cof-like phosphohydrolase